MRYFYDCEFIEDGYTIDLISIGIVAEDGRELSMQSCDFQPFYAPDWVKAHVFPSLIRCPHVGVQGVEADRDEHFGGGQCTFENPAKDVIGLSGKKLPQLLLNADCPWRTREQIRQEILAFMDIEKYDKPELWGYYSAYDHVAFCQLFGTMMDLPPGYPMYTRDLKQWCDALGNPRLPEQAEGEHHALADARWNKVAWDFLRTYRHEDKPVKTAYFNVEVS